MKNTRFGGIGLIVQLICLLCTQAFGATTFEQTRNGGIGDPPINPADWVNGNAGASNSHYVEGESIGYRLVLTGLSTGSHTAEIEWDIRSDSKNAIDYITHYQRINELVNPLRDLPGSFGPPNTFPIPPPPSSKLVGGIPQPTTSFNALPAAERLFTIYNGSITQLEYINNADGNLGNLNARSSSSRMRITFSAAASTVVLAWGGHIASQSDWGRGNAAGDIDGSPYHSRLIKLDGKGGNMDRSLSAKAVSELPNCLVSGPANVCGNSTNTYTVTTGGSGNCFLWSISGSGTIVGSKTGSSVQVLGGVSGTYTVSVTVNKAGYHSRCGSTCSKTTTINPTPVCVIEPILPLITNTIPSLALAPTQQVVLKVKGPSGVARYLWAVSYNGGAPVPLPVDAQIVEIPIPIPVTAAPSLVAAPLVDCTVILTTVDAAGCTSTCVRQLSLLAPEDCVIVTPINGCPGGQQDFSFKGDPAGYTFQWAITPPGSPVSFVGRSDLPAVTVTSALCVNYGLTLAVTDTNGIVTLCYATGSFVDVTPPIFGNLPVGGDLGCNPKLPACDPSVTAFDNCDGDISGRIVCTAGAIIDTTGCRRIQTFTYSVKDSCGNVTITDVTYTWKEDTTAPVLANLPTGGDLGCNPVRPNCSEAVTATDNCDGNLTRAVVCTPGPVTENGNCTRTQTFTYTVQDLCGNKTSAQVSYSWREDVTPPIFSVLPVGGDLGCNPTNLPSCNALVVAIDNCDGDISSKVLCTAGAITGNGDCLRIQTFTYSVKDSCGNAVTTDVTYTWKEDTTAPVLANLPTGGDLGCNPVRPNCSEAVTASDNCDGDLSRAVVCTPGPVTENGNCTRTQTFTYTVQDLCGNKTSAQVTYTWKEDTTAPQLGNLPQGGDLGCNPSVLPACSREVVAKDDCDGDLSREVVCTAGLIIENGSCSRTQTFTYTVKDSCGNEASAQVTYTWKVDTTAPVLGNLPQGGDLGCNPSVLPTCSREVVAKDDCDGDLTREVVCSAGLIIENGSCSRTQTFTYTVKDSCGNEASAQVTYTWKVDTTAPVLGNLPQGGDLGCNPQTLPTCSREVVAKDDCDGDLSREVVCTAGLVIENGSCSRTQTFTYTVKDSCGNEASAQVTYTWKVDTTAPVLGNLPQGGDLGCNPKALPTCSREVVAKDDCDGDLTREVVCTAGLVIENGSCSRTQTFTYTVKDSCGNEASAQVTYTWKVDTTAPVLGNLPQGGDLGCNPKALPTCSREVVAKDDCDGDLTREVVCTAGLVIENGSCSRTQTFTYTVKDSCGNEASAQVTYTWKVDTTAPVLGNLPQGGDLGCNPKALPTCSREVVAKDDCDGDLTREVVCTAGLVIENGSCSRTQTFTYTVKDSCGNEASAQVTYTWKVDTTAPVLGNLPQGGDLGCNPKALPTCSREVVAKDDCDGDLSREVVCTAGLVIENGSCSRTQTFTYTVKDSCGNEASAQVTYTWKVDTTAPVLGNLPQGGDLGCNPSVLPTCSRDVVAKDNCDGDLTASVVCTPGTITGNGDCRRSQIFTYTVKDSCGNEASAQVTYSWKEDTTAPVLSKLPQGGDLGCNPKKLPTCARGVLATDNCDGNLTASVVCTPGQIVSNGDCSRTQTFTYTVKDSCGNEASAQVTYTWKEDTTAPVIVCPKVQSPIECPASPVFTTPTVTDNCDRNPTLTFKDVTKFDDEDRDGRKGSKGDKDDDNNSRFGKKGYRITRTWTATDACGNTACCIQTIVVRDTTPPAVTWPCDVKLTCKDCNIRPENTGFPVATDACGTPKVTYKDCIKGNCPKYVERTWTVTDGVNTVRHLQIIRCTPAKGICGIVCSPYTIDDDGICKRDGKKDCRIELKDDRGRVLHRCNTDSDGCFSCDYTWSGKPCKLYLTVTPRDCKPQMREITVKSGECFEANFEMP